MYALTYCFEGTDQTSAFATTIAISSDIELLRAEMNKCIEEDCVVPEDDIWDDSKNFSVDSQSLDWATLTHNTIRNLYAEYKITPVMVLS